MRQEYSCGSFFWHPIKSSSEANLLLRRRRLPSSPFLPGERSLEAPMGAPLTLLPRTPPKRKIREEDEEAIDWGLWLWSGQIYQMLRLGEIPSACEEIRCAHGLRWEARNGFTGGKEGRPNELVECFKNKQDYTRKRTSSGNVKIAQNWRRTVPGTVWIICSETWVEPNPGLRTNDWLACSTMLPSQFYQIPIWLSSIGEVIKQAIPYQKSCVAYPILTLLGH